MTHYQNEKDDLLDYFARMLSYPDAQKMQVSSSAIKEQKETLQEAVSEVPAKTICAKQSQDVSVGDENGVKNLATTSKVAQVSLTKSVSNDALDLVEHKEIKPEVQANFAQNLEVATDVVQETTQNVVQETTQNVVQDLAQDHACSNAISAKDLNAQSGVEQERTKSENETLDKTLLTKSETLEKTDTTDTTYATDATDASASSSLKSNELCSSEVQEPSATQEIVSHDDTALHDKIDDLVPVSLDDVLKHNATQEHAEPLAMIVPIIAPHLNEHEVIENASDKSCDDVSDDIDAKEEKDLVLKDTTSSSCESLDSVKTSTNAESISLPKEDGNALSANDQNTDAKDSVSKDECVQDESIDNAQNADPLQGKAQIPEVAVQIQKVTQENPSVSLRTTPSLESLLEKVNSDLDTDLKVDLKLKEETKSSEQVATVEKIATNTQELDKTETLDKTENKLEEKQATQTLAQASCEELKTKEQTVTLADTAHKEQTQTVELATKTQVLQETKFQTQVTDKTESKCELHFESATEVASKEQVDTATNEVSSAQIETTPLVKEAQEAQIAQKELQSQTKEAVKERVDTTIAQATSPETSQSVAELTWSKLELPDEFQVLFFLVKGVRFAVPLIALGGIFECTRLTQIAGRPAWYKGMSDVRGTKLSVVDTMAWVKPEDRSEHDYKYLIVLDRSNWALGCDELEGNRILQKSQLKLRQKAGSRPWLAGIVKKEMCALLHVQAMTAMFDRGMALNKQE